jgi:hypothetical protein
MDIKIIFSTLALGFVLVGCGGGGGSSSSSTTTQQIDKVQKPSNTTEKTINNTAAIEMPNIAQGDNPTQNLNID